MEKINLDAGFARMIEPWAPRLAAVVGDCQVKLARLRGEFIWHRHEREAEVFLVWRGRLVLRFRDREVELRPGELLTIPPGVEHLPVAPEEAEVLLIEPRTTLNTGDRADSPLTRRELETV